MVSVVDDNESVRESLPDLLQHSGFHVEAFSSAEAFLQSQALGQSSCLILDVGLPGMSGPDLQQELKRRGQFIPIVFITAQGDKSLRPQLIGRGAVAVLFKRFTDAVARRGRRGDEVGLTTMCRASDAGHLTTLIAEVRSTGYAEASPSRAVSQRTRAGTAAVVHRSWLLR